MKITMYSYLIACWFLMGSNFALAFMPPVPTHFAVEARKPPEVIGRRKVPRSFQKMSSHLHHATPSKVGSPTASPPKASALAIIPVTMLALSTPAEAATLLLASDSFTIQSALWSYAHTFSILGITGCLVAERFLVKPDMSMEDENTLIKVDLLYGILAVLLIGSGFARATNYGKGGDFYIHEALFWTKMTLAGIWGGLSLFPSTILNQRKRQRKENPGEPPTPVSDALAARLRAVINAEISAILTIPLLAALMARGVGYQPDLPWQVGMVVSLVATGGSFYFYARQALNWSEEEETDDDEKSA